MLTALLVDDEQKNLDNLAFLLENDCNGVSVVARLKTASAAREWLAHNRVDVLFLDIHMPVESGFDLLDSMKIRDFQVVFVTAYDEYALQAIKASAFDYILKPVNIIELQSTVDKLTRSVSQPDRNETNSALLENLFNTVYQRTTARKIALPHVGGISFVNVNDIISLQADSNYTVIHLKNMQKMVISKTLKEFEELLDPSRFARIHKSYIVNLEYIKEYSSIDGGIVKMIDGNQWSISRRQLDSFLDKMKTASLMFPK